MTLYCNKCKKELPKDRFYKRSDTKKGYRAHCKKCLRKADNLYCSKNREYLLDKSREWRSNNIEKTLYSSAKNRAKKKGLDFNIELSDIVIPEYCPVFGTKLEKQYFKKADNSPSIDRIDNTKGYIKGNIAVISVRANVLKNNATKEELEKIIKWMSCF